MTSNRLSEDNNNDNFLQNALLFEQLTGIGYWKVDIIQNTLQWSDRTYNIFGVSPETFYPTLDSFQQFIHPDDLEAVLTAVYASRETGTPYQIEHRIIRADSSVSHVLESGRHEFDKDGQAVIFRGTVQDVSSITVMRERLIRAERLATLSRLVGDIAHDFNNLLATIGGNLELLEIEFGESQGAGRLINRARESIQVGAESCERLLNFFDQRHSSSETINLVSFVEQFLSTVTGFVGEHIEFDFNSEAAELVCEVNKARLESSILNALANARDAMPQGGQIRFLLSRAILDGNPIPMACISISDDGMGIDPLIQGRVFEPFFSSKVDEGGTGLGLSIIRDFAHDSGGQVAIYSLPGAGTKLTLFLPLSRNRPESGSFPNRLMRVDGAGKRILFVEDNRNVRSFVQDGLAHYGFNVIAFSSPVDALEFLEQDPSAISAVVSDLRLPDGIDGFNFTKLVRKRFPTLPALFITGYLGDFERALSSHELDAPIVTKPFQISDLASALNDLL